MASEKLPPPKQLIRPLMPQSILMMGPGPSNLSTRAKTAGSLPLIGHFQPEFHKILDEIKEGIKYLFQTRNKYTFAVSGAGHAAMEACVVNIVEPKDKVLVLSSGLWGDRIAEICERQGANLIKLTKPAGEVFHKDEIKQALEIHRPVVTYAIHAESSSGTCQPLEGVGRLCHQHGCLFGVDAVASAGGIPLYMDDWEIDLLYTGAQKCLSSTPGASPISFSDLAWKKILNRKVKPTSFYLDAVLVAEYWNCWESNRKYHHTAPIHAMYSLREALAVVAEEGLENMWHRHKTCSELLHKGLKEMGLEFFCSDSKNRLYTVTAIKVPEGVDWTFIPKYAMEKYRTEIVGALGHSVGKIWRIGVLGVNAQPHKVRHVLTVLREALTAAGWHGANSRANL